MEIDRAGLEVLSRSDCMELLQTTNLGRVGISWQAMPMILPVHFALDAGRILVATWDGSILSKATRGTVVAFEAEGPSGCPEPSWSVLVNGVADHCDSSHRAAPPARWADDQPRRLLSITTERVTGRGHVGRWPGTFGSGRVVTIGSTIEP